MVNLDMITKQVKLLSSISFKELDEEVLKADHIQKIQSSRNECNFRKPVMAFTRAASVSKSPVELCCIRALFD